MQQLPDYRTENLAEKLRGLGEKTSEGVKIKEKTYEKKRALILFKHKLY